MIAILAPAGFLVLASLVVLSSISAHFFAYQLVWVIIGSLFVVLFLVFDWRSFLYYRWSVLAFYAFTIFLLLLVLFTAPTIRNTRSWIKIGSFTFQPVELVKLALILVYAQYFSRRHIRIAQWENIFASFVYFAIPAALVLNQPDLGSTLILFGIWCGFLLVSGLPLRRVAIGLLLLLIVAVFMWNWGLKPYQKERIIGVLYPNRDVLGINYSVNQSKIAIGNGGFWGKGYHQGTQVQLGFLTESQDDFVFAALAEEWGFFGGFLVSAVFCFLIVKILQVGVRADYNFEKFICLGAVIALSFQFLLNAGSATGIFPVVGVTFPFLSYGGSSLLTNFILLAIINSIAIRS